MGGSPVSNGAVAIGVLTAACTMVALFWPDNNTTLTTR